MSTDENTSPMARVLQAAAFAAERHSNQRRKGKQAAPYINHPIGVASCLADAGVEDPDILAAALLHDTVEDTDTSLEELEQLFGARVAGIVAEVTDDKSLPKAERKRLQILTASKKSIEAKQLKLADKICNLRDLRDNPPHWNDERINAYYRFAEDVAEGLAGCHTSLEATMNDLLAQRCSLHESGNN